MDPKKLFIALSAALASGCIPDLKKEAEHRVDAVDPPPAVEECEGEARAETLRALEAAKADGQKCATSAALWPCLVEALRAEDARKQRLSDACKAFYDASANSSRSSGSPDVGATCAGDVCCDEAGHCYY